MKALCILAFVALTAASPVQSVRSEAATTCQEKYPDNPRACFNGYDIDTNWYDTIPNTGVTREYFFDIVNTTAAPDGRLRPVILVNGQNPGPTIEANWGDMVKVHVKNSLQNNGTSIHFHGMRQLYTNQNDGVQSLTQCPVAPGYDYTYLWQATQYGSSWYHSHFSMQAWEGVFGGIVIHGPATADYDEDLGSMLLVDWSEQTVDEMYPVELLARAMPQFQAGLMNGTNAYQYPNGTFVGKRLVSTIEPGKRYRLRLVNAAVHTHLKFSIDNHMMKVIAADLTPIKPFDTNVLPMNMGQRYDIIITADQPSNDYWMRAVPQSFCSNNTAPENWKGVLHYSDSDDSEPTSTKWDYGDDFQCSDVPYEDLVPWVPLNATVGRQYDLPASDQSSGEPTLYLWRIGEEAFSVRWDDPTLLQTEENPNKTWTTAQNVFEIPKDQWTVFVIQTGVALSHPIHLHGHDFWVLAQGLGVYNTSNVTLNTNNPIRRDTVTLPSQPALPGADSPFYSPGGYVVIAFVADNPGSWLMHCHIGFHQTSGFGLQLLERKDEIPPLIDQDVLHQTCDAWNEYAQTNDFGVQDIELKGPWDSGI